MGFEPFMAQLNTIIYLTLKEEIRTDAAACKVSS